MTSINKSIKVVIPARYCSTRLPGKPLIDLCGEPMIIRVANRVSKALPFADLWIATDDLRIKDVVMASGYQVMLTSANHENGTDRIAELAEKLCWSDDEIIINIQGDEPLIDIDLLKSFSMFCADHESITMASVMVPITSIVDISDSNVVKVTTNRSGQATMFSRSPLPFCRDLPLNEWPVESFNRHVGIYAYKVCVIRTLSNTTPCQSEKLEKLEQLRALWLGFTISMLRWDQTLHAGVDSLDDVYRVRNILNNKLDW